MVRVWPSPTMAECMRLYAISSPLTANSSQMSTAYWSSGRWNSQWSEGPGTEDSQASSSPSEAWQQRARVSWLYRTLRLLIHSSPEQCKSLCVQDCVFVCCPYVNILGRLVVSEKAEVYNYMLQIKERVRILHLCRCTSDMPHCTIPSPYTTGHSPNTAGHFPHTVGHYCRITCHYCHIACHYCLITCHYCHITCHSPHTGFPCSLPFTGSAMRTVHLRTCWEW